MKRYAAALGAILASTLVVAVGGGAANLPAGTQITAAVTGLTDGQTIAQAPFTLTGKATVGVGQAVKNTTLIYIVDVSNSTSSPTGGTLCGRQSAYQPLGNETIDCELKAVRELNAAAITAGTVAKIGLIVFGGTNTDTLATIRSAAAADLDPSTTDLLIDPSLANFSNATIAASPGTPYVATNNLEWVLQSTYLGSNTTSPAGWPSHGASDGINLITQKDVGPSTNYYAALSVLKNVLLPAVTTPKTQVVFLSDGLPNQTVQGQPLSTILSTLSPANLTIDTFAVTGAGSTCGSPTPSLDGSLNEIAAHFGKVCAALADPEAAVSAVPGVIASKLTSATLKVDGSAIATDVSPALPQTGPASVALSSHTPVTLAPGDHQLCAFAAGQDGGGTGNTGDQCITVHVKAAPGITFDGGGDGADGTAGHVNEGSPFALDATLTGTADLTWAASGSTGTCTVADPASAHTSVTCDDNTIAGSPATITLTANDHVNAPVTLTEHLRVDNVDPTPTLTLGAGPHPLASAVAAHVSISDPGHDTFMCAFDWGDSSNDAVPATGTACDDSHTYAHGGTYHVTVFVTDDDHGSGSDTASVTVDAPPTIDFGGGPGRDGSFSGNEGSAILLNPGVVDDGTDTFAWSYAPGAGVDAGAACTFGNAANATTSITCTDDGDYNLTLRVSDGVNPPVEGHAVLHVSNVAPLIPSLSATTSGQTATVTAGTTDAGSNDTVTCSFDWGDGSTDAAGLCTRSHTYAAGVHGSTVTVTATDDDGGSSFRTIDVTLNRPPSCVGVAPSQADLWPPDHTLRLIVLGGGSDPDHDTLTYAITSVRQDEPTNGLGDGDTAIDAVAAGPGAVRLRAERSGTGDGRVYTIGFTISDGHGGSCTGTTTVSVAKSASKPAVLTPGPGYDSFH